MVIDGRRVAAQFKTELKQRIAALCRRGHTPTLAVFMVGDDPASLTYYRAKAKLADELGIRFLGHRFPLQTDESEFLARLDQAAEDREIDGIFVEFPLPRAYRAERVRARLDPRKDVDGVSPLNLGKLVIGAEAMLPATPCGVIELLRASGVELRSKDACIVGRSGVVGKPLALLLLRENATVTVCHSQSQRLAEHTRRAEILCVAAGKPKLITADMVRDGAVVVDIGLNATAEGIVGDVDFARVKEKAAKITPVPGGVGPMTAAFVMSNVVKAAERARQGAAT